MIVLLRLKGPPSAVRVVDALAMLSAITSERVLWADMPEDAMLIAVKSPILTSFYAALAANFNRKGNEVSF